jgi:hypothetical protein
MQALLGITPPPSPPDPVATLEQRAFDPQALTLEAIDELADDKHPLNALALAENWRRGLRLHKVPHDDPRYARLNEVAGSIIAAHRDELADVIAGLASGADVEASLRQAGGWRTILASHGLADDDPLMMRLDQLIPQLLDKADPITLASIEALLKAEDGYEALTQAEVWRDTLAEREVDPSDPRHARLVGVIEILRQRLLPRPPPTDAQLAEFRREVDRLAEVLRGRPIKLADGRAALENVERLLQEHPSELGPYSQRYRTLKQRFERAELLETGVARVREQLDAAEQALAASDVTAAAEALAKATSLAARTPIKKSDVASLQKRTADLRPKLKRAIGVRAANDAARCQASADTAARNAQVRQAYASLAEFPDSQVGPILSRVAPWRAEAQESEAADASSPLGRELAARDAYERALALIGTPDRTELLAACLSAEKNAPGPPGGPLHVKIETLLFDALEQDIDASLASLDATSDVATAYATLLQAQATLRQASAWRDSARYKSLDGALQGRVEDVASETFARAEKAAAAGNLAEAIEIAKPLEQVDLPGVGARATELRKQWQQELLVRQDKQKEDEFWNLIVAWESDPAKAFELRRELEMFRVRYPSSERQPELDARLKKVDTVIAAQVPAKLAAIAQCVANKRLIDAEKEIDLVAQATSAEAVVAQLEQLRAQIAAVRQQAGAMLARLTRRQRAMVDPEDITEVRRLVAEVLALAPDHQEARQLSAQAENNARTRSAQLLRSAQRIKNIKPEKYREKLTMAAAIDPHGPSGLEARRLLAE